MSVIATFKNSDGTIYMGADGICANSYQVKTVSANPKVVKLDIGAPDGKAPLLIGCVGNYRILNVVADLKLSYITESNPHYYVNNILVPKLRNAVENEPWAKMDNHEWGLTIIWDGCVFEVNHSNYEVMEPGLPYTANGAAMETMIGALSVQYKIGVHPASAIVEGLHVCDLHHVYAAPPFYLYAVKPGNPEVDCRVYGAERVNLDADKMRKFHS